MGGRKMKLRGGEYYECECPRCGKVKAGYLRGSNTFVCSSCNNDEGVKLTGEKK